MGRQHQARPAPRLRGAGGDHAGRRRSSLLRRAKAVLFPIDWPEPFGLVMTEAMACGTPVIATPRGLGPRGDRGRRHRMDRRRRGLRRRRPRSGSRRLSEIDPARVPRPRPAPVLEGGHGRGVRARLRARRRPAAEPSRPRNHATRGRRRAAYRCAPTDRRQEALPCAAGRRHRPFVGSAVASSSPRWLAARRLPPASAASHADASGCSSRRRSHVDTQPDGTTSSSFDPGVWVASVGGAFELRVSRPDYDTPVIVQQVDADDGRGSCDAPRRAPRRLVRASTDFVALSASGPRRHSRGHRQTAHVLPERLRRARACPTTSPLTSDLPLLLRRRTRSREGSVWGIDDGWAVGAQRPTTRSRLDGRAPPLPAPCLDRPVVGRRRSSIAPADAEAVGRRHGRRRGRRARRRRRPPAAAEVDVRPRTSAPTVTDPDPATLPDLVALPAWGIRHLARRTGSDYLTFNATEWNAGPGHAWSSRASAASTSR